MDLMKNIQAEMKITKGRSSEERYTIGRSWILACSAGDRLWIQAHTFIYCDEDINLSFSGMFLFPVV